MSQTQFIHFASGEALPVVGDVIRSHSQMTGIDYETRIARIGKRETLLDGRIRLTVYGPRTEVTPLQMPARGEA